MITTEREYRITKARIANPERAIAWERARTDLTPLMRQMYVEALTSNIEELAAEVRAYEDPKAGRVQIRSASLAELPTVPIRARVAHGWTQKQLAGLLGVTEQTIQRYEATGYGRSIGANRKDRGNALSPSRWRVRHRVDALSAHRIDGGGVRVIG